MGKSENIGPFLPMLYNMAENVFDVKENNK